MMASKVRTALSSAMTIVTLAVVLVAVSHQTTAGEVDLAGLSQYDDVHASSYDHQTGAALQQGGYEGHETGDHDSVDYVAYPKYQFAYGVTDPHTGDSKAQQESRDGHQVVGEYEVKEPGGNVRTVKYSSDEKGGFTAHVINNGANVHSDVHGHGDGYSIANFHGPVSGPSYPVPVDGSHDSGH